MPGPHVGGRSRPACQPGEYGRCPAREADAGRRQGREDNASPRLLRHRVRSGPDRSLSASVGFALFTVGQMGSDADDGSGGLFVVPVADQGEIVEVAPGQDLKGVTLLHDDVGCWRGARLRGGGTQVAAVRPRRFARPPPTTVSCRPEMRLRPILYRGIIGWPYTGGSPPKCQHPTPLTPLTLLTPKLTSAPCQWHRITGFARNRSLQHGEREFHTEFLAGNSLTTYREREPGGQSGDPVDTNLLG